VVGVAILANLQDNGYAPINVGSITDGMIDDGVWGDISIGMIFAIQDAILANINEQLINWINEEGAEIENDGDSSSDAESDSFPDYPGDDPTKSPGEGWEWRGKGDPSSGEGNWYNPETGEILHPDLNHQPPVEPHWDYRGTDGKWYRFFPDGSMIPKFPS
jgi:hypothetical protein